MKFRVLVAGGGIGGLTAAIALARRGHQAQVFERAPELRALGAGLTLQPNAIAALRTLGLADAVVAAGRRSGVARIRQASGRLLAEMDVAAFWREEAGVTLHRATLQRLLAEQVPAADLALGAEIESWEELPRGGGVRLRLAGGGVAEGDLLVGADGIHSAVRKELLGDGPPLYAGYYCWRGVCADPGLGLSALSESWGRGRRFGLVPIDGGRIYWFAVVNGPPGGQDAPGGVKAKLAELFAGWHEPIGQVIAATAEEAIVRGDILYRRTAATWGRGRVTLLGDAAHPMTPDLGQGACQAIEDAAVLAACLDRGGDPAAALRRYESLRQPRTAAIVRQAARIGQVAQWESPLLCALRDFLNRSLPQRMLEKQVAALWRFPS